jgi:LmbE family N-acetylglucosaminyl deacetylase
MEFTHFLSALSTPFNSIPIIPKPSVPFTVMILSPHPDDEAIIGSLPLRLLKENNAHVVNVAVTLGSKKERQKARLQELEKACVQLEFELIVLSEDWKEKLKELKSLIQKYQPQMILAPHLEDHHPTHIKTGKLLLQASKAIKFNSIIVWTEFWGQLKKPNLLIEVPKEVVEIQMRALECHQGEIQRNPYHLRLPAWMMDNVRRGAEVVGSVSVEAPQFPFGVIYQIQILKKGKLTNPKLQLPFLSNFADLGQIFSEILEAASGSKTKVK